MDALASRHRDVHRSKWEDEGVKPGWKATGLATMDAASGTFVAYATAPGRSVDDGTGANGLYTESLIRYMRTPGLKVEDVFKRVRIDVEKSSAGKQVSWESSSLKRDFYFSGSPVAAALTIPPSSPAKPVGPARTIDEEEALWKVSESSTNPVDFEEYLSAFPQGRFAVAVRAKLRQYQVMNHGTLEGAWAKGSGKESLTPEP
jgi:hypothetical protein